MYPFVLVSVDLLEGRMRTVADLVRVMPLSATHESM